LKNNFGKVGILGSYSTREVFAKQFICQELYLPMSLFASEFIAPMKNNAVYFDQWIYLINGKKLWKEWKFLFATGESGSGYGGRG
jgi:hypothetical protein